ncbi:MAG: Fur family transcriptional regulator [Dehalococcoidia bacterium]
MSEAIAATEIVKRLGEHGLAASAQRVAVYGFIAGMGEQHLTADELHRALRESLPTLSRATVYNNLAALAEAGLIEKVDLPEGARFGRVPEPHVNLVCRECGNIEDVLVGDEAVREVLARAASLGRFDASAASITLSGRCRNCSDS